MASNPAPYPPVPPPTTATAAPLLFTRRDLFGGAMTCDIPTTWKDVSDVRQVPDHQECYQELPDGALLVVEILERQQAVTDANAANYFFKDLAEANGSTESQFETLPIVAAGGIQMLANANTSGIVLCGGVGYQRVAMGRDYDINGNRRQNQEIRTIQVELCVFRLARVSTDLLVTVSKPVTNPNEPEGIPAFQRAVSTLNIRDWSLFG